MNYRLEFTIPFLPKTLNEMSHKHWRVKQGESKRWEREVWMRVANKRPDKPLTKAQISLTRASSVEPDFDGLVGSWKYVIDALTKAGIIADDKMSVIGQPSYNWEKTSPRKGFIKVIVEAA